MANPLPWSRPARFVAARSESRLQAHGRHVHAMLVSAVVCSLTMVAVCAYVLTHAP